MNQITNGNIIKLPNERLSLSGWIEDMVGTRYFVNVGIIPKTVELNQPVIFSYEEHTNKVDKFGKPRLDVLEILEVDYEKWLNENKKENPVKLTKNNNSMVKPYDHKAQSINNLNVFFESGDQEARLSLLLKLESSLSDINSEQKYSRALDLIEIDKKYKLDEQLVYRVFLKSNALFRYKLWLDRHIDFCDPKYVYRKVAKGHDCDIINERLESFSFKNNSNIEVHFKQIRARIIENIAKAQKTLQIAIAWFTNYEIFEKLLEVQEAGVKIDLIILNDLINNGGYSLDFNVLIEKGVNLYISEYPTLMHHKFCIIDDKILLNGSYNWTYYAESINEENLLVIKDKSTINLFQLEFDKLVEKFERVDVMPEHVTQSPEFDRSSFKHYITHELQIKAETLNERDKIQLLHQASQIDPLERNNKKNREKYEKEFNILNDQITVDKVTENILNENIQKKQMAANVLTIDNVLIHDSKSILNTPKESLEKASKNIESVSKEKQVTMPTSKTTHVSASSNPPNNFANHPSLLPIKDASIEKYSSIMCDNINLSIDNSGSMKHYFESGLVDKIVSKVISISLRYTIKSSIDVWTYNTIPNYLGTFDLNNLSNLKTLKANGGTKINALVTKLQEHSYDKVLNIVLTDGEDNTIASVVNNISNKGNSEFWQFIGLGANFVTFANSVDLPNSSYCTFENIESMKDEDIIEKMLKDYIGWMNIKQ